MTCDHMSPFLTKVGFGGLSEEDMISLYFTGETRDVRVKGKSCFNFLREKIWNIVSFLC